MILCEWPPFGVTENTNTIEMTQKLSSKHVVPATVEV